VAVDVQNYAVLLMDVHKWHGNTPFDPDPDKNPKVGFERVSLVMYYRKNMIACGTAQEEGERAKRKQII
jgi:hypothetical protein